MPGERPAADRRLLFVVASVAAGCCGTALAQTTTDLPSPGTAVRVGDLRPYIDETSGDQSLTSFGWTISPAAAVSQVYQSYSGNGGSNGTQGGLSTVVTPSIAVTGNSRRITGNLYYAPSLVITETGNGSTYVYHNISGSGHVTVIPETLFVDAHAYGSLRSYFANGAQGSGFSATQANQVPVYNFSVAPYLQHRFGGTGLGELGYAAQYSTFGSIQNRVPVITTSNAAVVPNSYSALFSNSEHAAFTTGEDFSRFNMDLRAIATQNSGSLLYTGSHSETELASFAYAVNRFFTPLASIGHETIDYPNALPPVRIDDVIWAAGGKVSPNADSFLTATYGHRYGKSNVFVKGAFFPTARLRIFANYSQTLTTGLQDLEAAANQADVLSSGTVVDRTTGQPIVLTDNFFGITNGVERLSRGSIGAILTYARDVFSVSLVSQQSKLIAIAPGQQNNINNNPSGYYGSLGWSHDLSPAVSLSASGTVGRQRANTLVQAAQTSNSTQTIYGGSASAFYRISETLTASAVYAYSSNDVNNSRANQGQSTALVTLRKQF